MSPGLHIISRTGALNPNFLLGEIVSESVFLTLGLSKFRRWQIWGSFKFLVITFKCLF